jgi:hypothetical protein
MFVILARMERKASQLRSATTDFITSLVDISKDLKATKEKQIQTKEGHPQLPNQRLHRSYTKNVPRMSGKTMPEFIVRHRSLDFYSFL